MCDPTDVKVANRRVDHRKGKETIVLSESAKMSNNISEVLPPPPTVMARLTCVSILVGIFALWAKFSFVDESAIPGAHVTLHGWQVPAGMNAIYLLSLPLLRMFSSNYLSKYTDVKLLLRESMILYNGAQVLLNGWMVYRLLDALLFRGHPVVGGFKDVVDTGAYYTVWIHYCDKYLEYLDTYFMVLRGRMDQVSQDDSTTTFAILTKHSHSILQVSFLHVYHHTSISFAWWWGIKVFPGGDSYFGALLNSWIHVMMYSYYTLSLLKIPCPWKRFLTQAQLLQFTAVLIYTAWSISLVPDGTPFIVKSSYLVQCLEMTSLFVLFLHFYRKAYFQKKASNKLAEANKKKALGMTTDSDVQSDTVAEQESISSASSSDEDRD